MSHITVERNRRRQMNEHLKILRSLTPSFYIKRGDQASVISGAIEFIKEMQQLFGSLERKKKRKSLSPTPSPKPAAFCRSSAADVEAKISGSNVMLKTLSKRIPGQVVRIVAVLERQAFEILHLNISSVEDTVLYSFVIKVCIVV
ncbi:Transcription factor MUTE [Platanthera guangdongensis]|uniref:Transcription factor MUTE n=1 Tax=Platanthera guangdongensis TaxID=2320717 RepID=A0ABR2MWZ4_9ASPA